MNITKNIVILGAGIIGLYTAYELLRNHDRDAPKITLYDPKGLKAQNASWMAGGMLAPYSEIEHMDMRWVELGWPALSFGEIIRLIAGSYNPAAF